jgi:ATP/maltotriose-dependent transcriptional regulator MalT
VQAPDAIRHCQEMLEYLERVNLFVIPLDRERRWYRYHNLFAEALLGRLHHLHPLRVPELQRRASAWYEHRGFLREAIDHAPFLLRLLGHDFLLAPPYTRSRSSA